MTFESLMGGIELSAQCNICGQIGQWRQREYKVGGRSAERGGVWDGVFPFPPGVKSGEEQILCFVISKWHIFW